MPLAEFPGRRNWGYDGVDLYAPSSAYGGPEGLRRLVDAAHGIGLGVLLDVVYNHFGPDGNYLRVYADAYFTDRHTTPWGDAINYDGPDSEHGPPLRAPERRATGWRSTTSTASAWTRPTPSWIRRRATCWPRSPRWSTVVPGRSAVVIAEDHRNLVEQIRPADQGGLGLDGVWADDFHHALRTYLTGEREAYYANYTGASQTSRRPSSRASCSRARCARPPASCAARRSPTSRPGRSSSAPRTTIRWATGRSASGWRT